MAGALSDPFDGCHMGVTAENVATLFRVSREDQDVLATESHRRAAAAAGYFKEQILPVEIPGKRARSPSLYQHPADMFPTASGPPASHAFSGSMSA
jgi:acetyl-CoA C-acetyltransferase